jgi:hypothetical protein
VTIAREQKTEPVRAGLARPPGFAVSWGLSRRAAMRLAAAMSAESGISISLIDQCMRGA